MKSKITVVLFLYMLFLVTPAFGATFEGRVIDADSKQPIEGAVVIISWQEERAGINNSPMRLKDVKEILTNKNGEWTILGPKGMEMGYISTIISFITGIYFTRPPEFIIFKPGYCSYPGGFMIEACKAQMKPWAIGNGETTELPKLSIRDRQTLLTNIPFISTDSDRAPIFKKLLNQDREDH